MNFWISKDTTYSVSLNGDSMYIDNNTGKKYSKKSVFAHSRTNNKHTLTVDKIYDVEFDFDDKVDLILYIESLQLIVCKMNTDHVVLDVVESEPGCLLGSLLINNIRFDIYKNTRFIFDKTFHIINTDNDLVLQSNTETDKKQLDACNVPSPLCISKKEVNYKGIKLAWVPV